MMKSIILVVALAALVIADQTDSEYWNNLGKQAIQASLTNRYTKTAKNVIIFVGGGMGVSTVTAARALRRQVEKIDQFSFETFPNVGLIKTYNLDYSVPDSAASTTAFMTGVKTNKGVIGVNGKVKYQDQSCDNIQKNKVDSVLSYAIQSGKSAGVVTSAGLTDATPAAAYAHVSDRNYESNSPIADKACKDIARQLVENAPGLNFSVALGGSTKHFLPKASGGDRADGLNLFEEWKKNKKAQGLTEDQYKVAQNREEFIKVDLTKVNSLLGSFGAEDLAYEAERDKTKQPSLTEMAEAAITILSKNPKGYFLLIEGGNIDNAHHENWANLALGDLLAFDQAINATLKRVNLEETLVLVTADHSFGFTQNGYAKRDENIYGVTEQRDSQNITYTQLLYATGPGYKAHRTSETIEQTSNRNYRQASAIAMQSGVHSGEDVAAYATGAMSHLLRAAQEQTYLAHLMSFAACVGPYQADAHCKSS